MTASHISTQKGPAHRIQAESSILDNFGQKIVKANLSGNPQRSE
jgi:hypothetical protein